MGLLEREPQLAALAEYAADARRGDGRLVLVSGESGVGKSALLEELERREADAVWAWGACDGLFTPRPLGPLLDIAATLGGGLRATIRDQRPREEIFQALLSDLAACTPYAALVVEDAHWADEATLDLLRFVARRIRRAPVLLLVTYRDDEVPPGHPLRRCLAQLATERSARRVDVPRLSPAAVAELAQGTGLEPDVLHDLTGGNPYFVTELLRGAPGDQLPTSARDAVLGRVDGLARGPRRLLETASLLGARADLDLLDELVAPEPEAWDALLDSGLLVAEGGDLRFRHEITRLAVQETVPPHRAAPVHARVLALLVRARRRRRRPTGPPRRGGGRRRRRAAPRDGGRDPGVVARLPPRGRAPVRACPALGLHGLDRGPAPTCTTVSGRSTACSTAGTRRSRRDSPPSSSGGPSATRCGRRTPCATSRPATTGCARARSPSERQRRVWRSCALSAPRPSWPAP